MAEIKVCDGCKAQSPDARGLYVANHWVTIKATWRVRVGYEIDHDWLLCKKCATAALKAVDSQPEYSPWGEEDE